jgi:hypothetical protein
LVIALESLKNAYLLVEAALLVEALPQLHVLIQIIALIFCFGRGKGGGDSLGFMLERVTEVVG